jgi:hypothetical protein
VKLVPQTFCEMQTIQCVRKVCYKTCRQVPETKTICCPVRVAHQVTDYKTVCVPRTVCKQVPVEVCVQVPVVVHCPPVVLPSSQSALASGQSVLPTGQSLPLTTVPPCDIHDSRYPIVGRGSNVLQ